MVYNGSIVKKEAPTVQQHRRGSKQGDMNRMSTPQAILNRLERIFNVVEITEGTCLTTEDGHLIEVRAIRDNERTYVHPADYPGYDLSTIVFVWCWDDPIDNTQWSDWVPADFLRDLLNEGTLTVTQNTVFDFS